ncbi:hypothetical protein [Herbidospora sp. RD11066]
MTDGTGRSLRTTISEIAGIIAMLTGIASLFVAVLALQHDKEVSTGSVTTPPGISSPRPPVVPETTTRAPATPTAAPKPSGTPSAAAPDERESFWSWSHLLRHIIPWVIILGLFGIGALLEMVGSGDFFFGLGAVLLVIYIFIYPVVAVAVFVWGLFAG